MTDVAAHYTVGDQLCSEQVELISALGSVSPNETCCQPKPLAWSIRTLNLIFLGCGKPARRMESCDEHIGAAEKTDDASEWSQGGSGCPRRRWKHPSHVVGEGPVAEWSWTCRLPGFPSAKRSLQLEPAAMAGGVRVVCMRGSLPSANVLVYGQASQWQIVLKSHFSGKSCN